MRGQHGPLVHELFGRGDYGLISEIVEPGSCVLDLGCGEGELLAWLADNKNVDARGVEISSAKLQKAIARGVSAVIPIKQSLMTTFDARDDSVA